MARLHQFHLRTLLLVVLAIGVSLGVGRWYYLNYVAEPPAIVWQKYSPDLLAKLRTGKRPILIHFSMEYTLSRDFDMSLIDRPLEVRWAVARTGAAVVLADMTERTPEMDHEHERLGGVNLSYTVVIFPGSPERVVRVENIADPDITAERLLGSKGRRFRAPPKGPVGTGAP